MPQARESGIGAAFVRHIPPLLAFAVVAQNLLAVPNIGGYSVHGFFVLSGFLMTMIMQERYGYTAGGFGRYTANRALRLLPANFVIVTASIMLIGTQFAQGLRKTDSWIGDMSYPVYLSHFGCALLVSMVVFGQETAGRTMDGLLMFAIAVPVIIGLSAAVNQFVERPIEHLRRRLKGSSAAAAGPIRSP